MITIDMPKNRHSSKLVPLEMRHEEQTLDSFEADGLTEQTERLKLELDIEIECPRCNEIMELHSKFDELLYSCESCSFLLRCL